MKQRKEIEYFHIQSLFLYLIAKKRFPFVQSQKPEDIADRSLRTAEDARTAWRGGLLSAVNERHYI